MHNMCLFFNYCKLTHTDYLICRTNNTSVRPCKKISRTPLTAWMTNQLTNQQTDRPTEGVHVRNLNLYNPVYIVIKLKKNKYDANSVIFNFEVIMI